MADSGSWQQARSRNGGNTSVPFLNATLLLEKILTWKDLLQVSDWQADQAMFALRECGEPPREHEEKH